MTDKEKYIAAWTSAQFVRDSANGLLRALERMNTEPESIPLALDSLQLALADIERGVPVLLRACDEFALVAERTGLAGPNIKID